MELLQAHVNLRLSEGGFLFGLIQAAGEKQTY